MTIAYLDPGSGSLIISAVVGGAAGAAVAVKHARARVTGVFKRKSRQADAVTEASDSAPETAPEPSAEAVAPGDSA